RPARQWALTVPLLVRQDFAWWLHTRRSHVKSPLDPLAGRRLLSMHAVLAARAPAQDVIGTVVLAQRGQVGMTVIPLSRVRRQPGPTPGAPVRPESSSGGMAAIALAADPGCAMSMIFLDDGPTAPLFP